MITPSQLLLSALILFVIFKTYTAYKKKNLGTRFVLLWIGFWIAVLFLVFQQNLVIAIARAVGISRGVDLVIYISLIVLFYLVYKIMVRLDEIDQKITEVVRRIALRKLYKKLYKKIS